LTKLFLTVRVNYTPKKPHHAKVENSIIKNKEFSHEKIKGGVAEVQVMGVDL
jgi:hypothetical protein